MNWEYDLERLLEGLDIYPHIGELDKFSVLIKYLLKERDEALRDATLHFTQRTFSTRPCTTCDLVSKIIKKPFGCKELRSKK